MFVPTYALLAVMGALVAGEGVPPSQVHIAVYYETLCPDSMKFVTEQLSPTFTSGLKPRLNVTLIPYGRATQGKNASGDVEFTCRHGPVECYGNRVQACAIKELSTDQPKLISLVNCLMKKADKNATYPIDTCAEQTGVTAATIVTCANGTESVELVEKYGDLTQALTPPLKSVPTIVLNGTYSEDNQKKAVGNLKALICSQLQGDKPNDCSGASSTAATATISVILMLVVSRMF